MLYQFPSGCTADLSICFLYVYKCNLVCIGHLFDQFIFLCKHLFVYSYTAKFVLDLQEIRKARFSHYTMQLLIFGVKTPGPNLLLFYKNNKINAGREQVLRQKVKVYFNKRASNVFFFLFQCIPPSNCHKVSARHAELASTFIKPVNLTYHLQAPKAKIVSEYDQEIPQSQTADNPVAPQGRAAQPSRDTRKTN